MIVQNLKQPREFIHCLQPSSCLIHVLSRVQLVFEEFGFQSCLKLPAANLALRAHGRDQPGIAANRAACGLVVDAGFSFTHVVPVFDGHAISSGIKRINIGGKLLTNYLKELVSYRCMHPLG